MVFQLQQWWFWLELQLQETWKIERVLYGLREAPRLWSLFRNDGLQAARIPYDGKMLILLSLDTDENLWKICYEGQEQEPEGLMLIYVDDILVLSQPDIISRRYTGGLQLSGSVPHWRCWWVDHYGFWGVELKVQDNGIHMSQSGYVRDLLRQHGVQERAGDPLTVPCSREWLQDEESGDEDGAPEEATIRMAQKATGEALWLSTRSRPELAHSVACMAGKALKKPLRTLEISKRVIQYLAKTADYGIMYKPSRDDPLLVVYSDASFAPGGGRSFGCVMAQIGGMPVAWRASKQPVITLSVAEAELYEGVAAVQLGLGVGAMMSEVAVYPVMHLRIDNAAAQGLASQAPGSWKTRHLRVRARFLRQEVSAQRLVITHVPGSLQKADIGTKGFDLPKFKELMSLWGNLPYSLEVGSPALRMLRASSTGGMLLFIVLCLLLIRGAEGTKENLPLDGSMELYFVVILCVVAAIALWEALKRMMTSVRGWWMGCQRKKKKLERLRGRARTAVQEEILRHMTPGSPLSGGAASSAGRRSTPSRTQERQRTPTITPTREEQQRTVATTSMRSSPNVRATEYSERPNVEVKFVSRGVQTEDGGMIGVERLRGFEGPCYMTSHGDRVHLSQYCHGQRNAVNPSRPYQICQYCDRDRPLFELGAKALTGEEECR